VGRGIVGEVAKEILENNLNVQIIDPAEL